MEQRNGDREMPEGRENASEQASWLEPSWRGAGKEGGSRKAPRGADCLSPRVEEGTWSGDPRSRSQALRRGSLGTGEITAGPDTNPLSPGVLCLVQRRISYWMDFRSMGRTE